MSFANIKSDLAILKHAIEERQIGGVLRAFGTVCIDAADVADLLSGGFAATPESAADKAECTKHCQDIVALCEAPQPMQADAVGKLFPGDGSVLKAIAALLVKLAPLFI